MTVRDAVAADITRAIASSGLEPVELLSAVLAELSRLGAGTWVGSVINRDATSVQVRAASTGSSAGARYIEDLQRSGDAVGWRIGARVIETGKPVVRTGVPRAEFEAMLGADVRGSIADQPVPFASSPPAVSYAVVPMRSRGALVGTLGLFQLGDASALEETDVEWMQEIADRTGAAVENAQLYADAGLRFERLAALNSLSLAVAATADLHATLQLVLDQVRKGLRVDAADVLLADDSGTALVGAAHAGFRSASMPGLHLPVDRSVAGKILARRRIEVRAGLELSEFTRRTAFAREGFRSYAGAPLVARGRSLGVLEVFHRSQVQQDAEWIAFLESVAGFTAVAVDGASMADRLATAATAARRPGANAPRLNPLERQILALVVEGTTNADIARAVHLSQSTVKFHVRQILQRVGATNRTELARKATREGWL